MRLTRLGWGCLAVGGLALMSAVSTGNNLLYLLYGSLFAALAVSAVGGRLNLRGLSAEAQVPGMVFRSSEFPLRVALKNAGRWPAYGLWVCGGGRRAWAERLGPGGAAGVELRRRLPHRGLNRLDDLAVESSFPFALIRHRRALAGAVAEALPKLREVRASAEVKAEARAEGRPDVRKGTGDELYGIREYDSSDDARSINWKLTAKAGRPLVNEYCAVSDNKVTVSVGGVAGPGAEDRIEDAGSACKFYLDRGVEVRLKTPEEEVPFGRGLLQLERILRALARQGDGKVPRPAGEGGAPAPAGTADSPALRRLTLAGVALVYAGLFLIDDISPAMLLLLAPILPLAWLTQERGWPRPPAPAWNLLSFLMLVYIVLVDWPRSGVIIADTHLIIYLLANRCLSVVRREELGQLFLILFLAFFLISGLTISLWYFAAYMGFLAFCALWLGLVSGLSPARWRSWGAAQAAWLLASLALTAVVFVVTPRVEGLRRINPFLAAGIDKLSVKPSSVTGFSENVSLGWFGELRRSSSRVMRVKPSSLPPGRRPPPVFIRGAAFEVFDGRRWSKPRVVDFRYRLGTRSITSTVGRGWALRRGDKLLFPAAPASAGMPAMEFTLYPMGLAVLFTVGTPWLVEPAPDAAFFDYTDSIYLVNPYMRGFSYRLYANPGPIGFGRSAPDYEARLGNRFLQLPAEKDPRIRELALRLTAGSPDALGKARAVEQHLRRGYAYSLFSEDESKTLEDFLFKSKKGNCEYFASAGAIMLRHAGVRSRLVTGFLADEWNEFGRFYDVRQSQAHAWVEAYIPGVGWLSVDPTPPQSGFSARADALSRRLERYFNAIQAEWYRRVIGYDQFVQKNTFLQLSLSLPPRLADLALKGGLLAAVLFALGMLARAARRAWRALLARRQAGFYQRAEAALARAGLAREPHLTPREYARLVASRRPELSGLPPLAELHYIERYAGRRLTPEESAEASRLYKEIRSKT